jgi:hypothetical protein
MSLPEHLVSGHLALLGELSTRLNSLSGIIEKEILLGEFLESTFLKYFSSATEPVSSTLVRTLLSLYYQLAQQADTSRIESSQIPDRVETCARLLTRYYNLAVNDRSPNSSRKVSLLSIFGVLMPIFVFLDNWRLAGTIVRALDNINLGDGSNFGSKADRVKYEYWKGRHEISQGEAQSADRHFSNAMQLCYHTSNDSHNLSLIYNYRSLLRLYLYRKLPRDYQNRLSGPFRGIIATISKGDINGFRKVVKEHQNYLLKQHLYYFVVAKLSHLLPRQLTRKVWLVTSGESRIPLSLILSAQAIINRINKAEIEAMDCLDLEELECLLANSIFEGQIKGYISHEKSTLVLSKKNPFP